MKRVLSCLKHSEKNKTEENSAVEVISLYLWFKICRKEILWNVCIPQLDSGHSEKFHKKKHWTCVGLSATQNSYCDMDSYNMPFKT